MEEYEKKFREAVAKLNWRYDVVTGGILLLPPWGQVKWEYHAHYKHPDVPEEERILVLDVRVETRAFECVFPWRILEGNVLTGLRKLDSFVKKVIMTARPPLKKGYRGKSRR